MSTPVFRNLFKSYYKKFTSNRFMDPDMELTDENYRQMMKEVDMLSGILLGMESRYDQDDWKVLKYKYGGETLLYPPYEDSNGVAENRNRLNEFKILALRDIGSEMFGILNRECEIICEQWLW